MAKKSILKKASETIYQICGKPSKKTAIETGLYVGAAMTGYNTVPHFFEYLALDVIIGGGGGFAIGFWGTMIPGVAYQLLKRPSSKKAENLNSFQGFNDYYSTRYKKSGNNQPDPLVKKAFKVASTTAVIGACICSVCLAFSVHEAKEDKAQQELMLQKQKERRSQGVPLEEKGVLHEKIRSENEDDIQSIKKPVSSSVTAWHEAVRLVENAACSEKETYSVRAAAYTV